MRCATTWRRSAQEATPEEDVKGDGGVVGHLRTRHLLPKRHKLRKDLRAKSRRLQSSSTASRSISELSHIRPGYDGHEIISILHWSSFKGGRWGSLNILVDKRGQRLIIEKLYETPKSRRSNCSSHFETNHKHVFHSSFSKFCSATAQRTGWQISAKRLIRTGVSVTDQ